MTDQPGVLAYVVGFVFTSRKDAVILIKKDHPAWQAHKLNGVGGSVRDDESFERAMSREFLEEAGVDVDVEKWNPLALLTFPGGTCFFFYLFDDDVYNGAKTAEREEVSGYDVAALASHDVVDGLRYLIPLCLHWNAAGSGSRLMLPIQLNEAKV